MKKATKKKTSYLIDQSGKIEQTNINTVVALTNGKKRTVVLGKRDKRIIEKMFKKMGKMRGYPYVIFAALLGILLRLADVKNKVVVDREYIGHENTIRERTLHFLRVLGVESNLIIEFGHVEKLSNAHDLAAKVGSKKVRPDKIVSLKEVMGLVLEVTPQKKTEVG